MDHITIIPSRRFVKIINELRTVFGAPESIKEKFSEDEDLTQTEISLTTQEVKWCHSKMRERGIPERVHELLAESEIVLPKYEPPPRNPELEARVERLRREQENAEYKNMVRSVEGARKDGSELSNIGQELRSVNRQIVSGLQYVVSIVGTFFAIFIALGMATPDYGVRALAATICALIVGLAEIFFIIRDDLREEHRIEKAK